MKYQKLCDILSKYLPEPMVKDMAGLIAEHKVLLRITRPRVSKLGDYRSPAFNGRHTISINNNLNTYAFAVTLLHELAHLLCFKEFGSSVKPHGKEWKSLFTAIARPYLNPSVFPEEVLHALEHYFANPGASTCADPNLLKVLSRFDAEPSLLVEDVDEGSVFELENGRRFKKGKKRRTRYHCICISTNRPYLVSAVAKIKGIV